MLDRLSLFISNLILCLDQYDIIDKDTLIFCIKKARQTTEEEFISCLTN